VETAWALEAAKLAFDPSTALSSLVTLGQLLNVSELQFPLLWNRDKVYHLRASPKIR
jgi:hypothetical protein